MATLPIVFRTPALTSKYRSPRDEDGIEGTRGGGIPTQSNGRLTHIRRMLRWRRWDWISISRLSWCSTPDLESCFFCSTCREVFVKQQFRFYLALHRGSAQRPVASMQMIESREEKSAKPGKLIEFKFGSLSYFDHLCRDTYHLCLPGF